MLALQFTFTDHPPEPPVKKVKLATGVGIPAKAASQTITQRHKTTATAPSQPKGPVAKAKAPMAQNHPTAAPSESRALTARPTSSSAEHPAVSQNMDTTEPVDTGHYQYPTWVTPLARIPPTAPAPPDAERAGCIPSLNLPNAAAVGLNPNHPTMVRSPPQQTSNTSQPDPRSQPSRSINPGAHAGGMERVLADIDEEFGDERSEGQREDVGYWDGEDAGYWGGEDVDYGGGEDAGYGTGEDMNEVGDKEREEEDEEDEPDEEEDDAGGEGPGDRQSRCKRGQGKEAVIKKASAFGSAAPAIQMACRYVRSTAITKTPMASIEEEEKIIRDAWPAVMQLKPFRGQNLPWEEGYDPTVSSGTGGSISG